MRRSAETPLCRSRRFVASISTKTQAKGEGGSRGGYFNADKLVGMLRGNANGFRENDNKTRPSPLFCLHGGTDNPALAVIVTPAQRCHHAAEAAEPVLGKCGGNVALRLGGEQ
jgi:hypothetical protein